VEFHGSHRNVQEIGDLFVRPVAQNRMEDLLLPGAQRSGAGDGSSFFQQFLRTRYEPFHQNALRGYHHVKIPRFLSSHEALHGK
jgi:hypothetical protein